MKTNQIKEIFERYLINQCTTDDIEILIKYFDMHDESYLRELIRDELKQNHYNQASTDLLSIEEEKRRLLQTQQVYTQLQQKIKSSPHRLNNPKYWKKLMGAAAVLVALSSALVYTLWYHDTSSVNSVSINTSTDNIFLREYSDITIMAMDATKNTRTLTVDEWHKYGIELNNDTLQFGKTSLAEAEHDLDVVIKTEKGQTQLLKLLDGTLVWLNSNTEITLPHNYAERTRRIALKGEAYFEVTNKMNQPFEVHAFFNTTQVLGTHFNVSARPKQVEKTSVVEGAVNVYNQESSILVMPGEQAFGNKAIRKTKVDVSRVLGWKQGDFYFDHVNIEELMDIIVEWYDVKHINYNHKSKDRFSGIFKRTNSLEELLRNLELVSSIRFEIKNGGLYVLEK